jgi:adenylate kinase
MENLFFKKNLYPLSSLLIFGPPGSGKGTLGKSLAEVGNHLHLSSGEIFRGLLPSSPAGEIFHRYAAQGNLVPDEITVAIWKYYLEGLIATNRYFPEKQLLLLDGIPRTLGQAQLLTRFLNLKKIVVLEIRDISVLIQRMQRRAYLENRLDDQNFAVLKTRMEVYAEETAKLLDYYPAELMLRLDAGATPLEVLRDVLVQLTPLLSSH